METCQLSWYGKNAVFKHFVIAGNSKKWETEIKILSHSLFSFLPFLCVKASSSWTWCGVKNHQSPFSAKTKSVGYGMEVCAGFYKNSVIVRPLDLYAPFPSNTIAGMFFFYFNQKIPKGELMLTDFYFPFQLITVSAR